MSKRDYYEVLGVDKNASESDIKQAYRKIAKEHHPDKNPDNKESEEIFKEAAEAYEVLSNNQKRSDYDQFGHGGPRNNQNGYGGMSPEDILNSFTGGGGYRQRIKRGQHIRLNIKLTLEEIYTGLNKKLKYKKLSTCGDCHGEIITCNICKGSGMILRTRQAGNIIMQETMVCGSCKGSGNHKSHKIRGCETCNGNGLIEEEVLLNVDIPSGVQDGMQLEFDGGGHSILGGVDGNVIVMITQLQHELFTRSINDLNVHLDLTYTQLVLGDKVEVPTIEGGKIRVTIPPYSKVGHHMIINGKGLKSIKSPIRGDMILILGIKIPTSITNEEKELLKKLDEIRNKVAL